jgi:hypothetical protein
MRADAHGGDEIMANQSNLSQARNRQRGETAIPSAARQGAGTQDTVYGLVSVLYHALQGDETYQAYVNDAEQNGDDELQQFFETCRAEEQARAERAKSLLLTRLEEEDEDSDDEEDDDEEDDDDEDDEGV